MARKVILLAGAPPPSTVKAQSCTLDALVGDLDAFLGRPPPSYRASAAADSHGPALAHAAWRSVPLRRRPLHTGYSQIHHHDQDEDSLWRHRDFFTTADLSVRDDEEGPSTSLGDEGGDLLTQFCEQSLAAHNSTLAPDSFDQSMSEEDTSFVTTTSADRTEDLAAAGEGPVPPTPSLLLHLSDLEDVPPARAVLALAPQTVTLNLIAGVLSVAQPRAVTTRWGRALSLVEVILGDDTASGFGVTFWLDDDDDDSARSRSRRRQTAAASSTTSAVAALRRQDVVLLRNVALHVFRGKVYGQSLRGGLTSLELLWRADGAGCYSSKALARAAHPQSQKTARVRDWVLRFVGADPRLRRGRAAVKSWDVPPDDTQ